MIRPLHSPLFQSMPRVRHGFFTRQGGVSQGGYGALNCRAGMGDDDRAVVENRARVGVVLESPTLLTLNQVHETRVVTVTKPWTAEDTPTADALVTDKPGLALGILTADCGPLLFADPEAGVIGAAHAGWRGAFLGIAERTLEAMEKLGASAGRVHVALGPCIAQASYEVDDTFRQNFLQQDAAWGAFFVQNQRGRYQFDLPGYILARLARAGVAQAGWTEHDTCAQEGLFFSHRRSTLRSEAASGRQVSAIVLY